MSCAEGVPETAEGREKREEVPEEAVSLDGRTTKDLHFDGSSADPCEVQILQSPALGAPPG
jgi:hypothetical protein